MRPIEYDSSINTTNILCLKRLIIYFVGAQQLHDEFKHKDGRGVGGECTQKGRQEASVKALEAFCLVYITCNGGWCRELFRRYVWLRHVAILDHV